MLSEVTHVKCQVSSRCSEKILLYSCNYYFILLVLKSLVLWHPCTHTCICIWKPLCKWIHICTQFRKAQGISAGRFSLIKMMCWTEEAAGKILRLPLSGALYNSVSTPGTGPTPQEYFITPGQADGPPRWGPGAVVWILASQSVAWDRPRQHLLGTACWKSKPWAAPQICPRFNLNLHWNRISTSLGSGWGLNESIYIKDCCRRVHLGVGSSILSGYKNFGNPWASVSSLVKQDAGWENGNLTLDQPVSRGMWPPAQSSSWWWWSWAPTPSSDP